jgi:hypothetical protein
VKQVFFCWLKLCGDNFSLSITYAYQ